MLVVVVGEVALQILGQISLSRLPDNARACTARRCIRLVPATGRYECSPIERIRAVASLPAGVQCV